MIDVRLVPDEQAEMTPGEAVAAMILNDLGFANTPLTLTPPFFAHQPLDLLFREGGASRDVQSLEARSDARGGPGRWL
jgi:hypothetical protein